MVIKPERRKFALKRNNEAKKSKQKKGKESYFILAIVWLYALSTLSYYWSFKNSGESRNGPQSLPSTSKFF